jgi:hypothetical protein
VLAQDRDSWNLGAWVGSSWLNIGTGGFWYCGLDQAGSGLGQVACTCECGNELSVSIKCG